MKQRLLDYREKHPNGWAQNILDKDLKKDLNEYQEFVNLPIAQKAAAIILGNVPSCECGNPVKFSSKVKTGTRGTPYGGWLDFCSRSCMQKSSTTTEKRKKTNIERYGADSWAKSKVGREALSKDWSEESKEKFNANYKKTCMERYGVEHFSKTSDYLEKRSSTILAQTDGKYTNYFQDIEKIKQSNIERYGVDSWKKTEDGKAVPNVMLKPEVAMKSRLQRMTNSGRYDEKLLVILLEKDPVKFKAYIDNIAFANGFVHRQQIANQLRISYTFLNALFRKFGMSNDYLSLGTSRSYIEETVAQFLRELGVQFKRGDRSVLSGKEIDFLIEDNKLGIEFNGLYYHSEFSGGKDKDYHLEKTLLAEAKGYQLLHILENEWNDPIKQNIWKSIIRAKLGLIETKIYARKCQLVEIRSSEAKSFFNLNHLSGFVPSSVYLGLVYNDELVSALSYGKSRFKKDENEIYRFASKIDCLVVGALGKFIARIPSENLITYADRRISGINSAYRSFFKNIETTPPTWYGFQNGTSSLQHRLSFTKFKVKELYPEYDDSKTVIENMNAAGFDRIWDCGHWKFSARI